MIPLYNKDARSRIHHAVTWVEAYGHILVGTHDTQESQTKFRMPCRGILLQDVYGGGSGVAELVFKTAEKFSFTVSIIGRNPIPDSAFKLKVWGITKAGTTAELFTSGAIPALSTKEDMAYHLYVAAQNAGLPVNTSSFRISTGNPMSLPEAIITADTQPELDKTDLTDVSSYVGQWTITVGEPLRNNYSDIYAEVVQDNSAFMRGLSTVVTRRTQDLPSGEFEIFIDVHNRPKDYPWRTGSLCSAIYFMDIGMGIVSSSFNEITPVPYAES